MKILYIHQYFATPEEKSAGTRTYWISQELIKDGHEVTMLTSSGDMDSRVEHEHIDGINVIYLKVPYDQNMGIFKRLISFLRFMFSASRIALTQKQIDLVIATSTPLTVGFPALLVKKIKKIPYIFEVRDLWPEVPIQMGALKNKWLKRIAVAFEKKIYKNAAHIVALSPGMLDGVKKFNIPETRLSMIPNMSKIDVFWSRKKDLNLVEKLGLKQNSFKVVYFGAMGLANGMEYIIEGIKELKEYKDIEVLFMGGGSTEKLLKKQCENLGIHNAHFLGSFSLAELSKIVNLCDISLVTFSDLPILATNSPNKLFDSLSAGKAIIVNSPGWTKEMVEKHNCGVFCDPKKPEELTSKILYLKNNPEICLNMGSNARKLAETKYDKSILCREFADVVLSLEENG